MVLGLFCIGNLIKGWIPRYCKLVLDWVHIIQPKKCHMLLTREKKKHQTSLETPTIGDLTTQQGTITTI